MISLQLQLNEFPAGLWLKSRKIVDFDSLGFVLCIYDRFSVQYSGSILVRNSSRFREPCPDKILQKMFANVKNLENVV